MDLNKKSVKQQGGAMMPGQPGMQQQPQVDPQVMQITEIFSTSIDEGRQPQEVLMGLMQQEVDQNLIGQALMQLGYEEEAIIQLFEEVQRMQQPKEPSPQEITNNPQQLARAEEMQEQAPAMDMDITSIDQAKSGIEIKPKNKGKFTRWAKARGMSVSEAYNKVMSNTDNYPPSVVKMANFAKNAAGWKKEEGGEFEPHFMYKGDRKIRARDHEAHLRLKKAGYTHDAPKAQEGKETSNSAGTDNLDMMNSFANAAKNSNIDISGNNVKVTDQDKNVIKDYVDQNDNGYINPDPFMFNPALFKTSSGLNLGKTLNAISSVGKDLFSGKDEDGDGVKDGSFRDWKGRKISNQLQKAADTKYKFQFDLSDENKNAAAKWFEQFKIENPELDQQKDALGNIIKTEADRILDDVNAPSAVKKISDDLLKKWQTGTAETKAYIESILKKKGQEIPTEYKVDPMSADGKVPATEKKDPQEVDLDPGFDQHGIQDTPDSGFDENGIQDVLDPGFDMFIPKDYDGPLDPKFDKGLPNFTDFQEMFAMYGAELPIKQFAGSAGGPVANDKLTFKEWVVQDPVTRGGANAQQLYAEYVEQFDNPFNPNPTEDQTNSQPAQRTAADLFGDINLPTAKKDKSPNALLSNFNNSLLRFPNTIGGRLFGDLSNAAVQTADIFNDIYQQKEWNNAYADMRGDVVADNLYGTTTDAFNKRGTFDVNTGLMGSEGDRTTGLYMSKEGGGVNNPGFKALPPEAQHNILSNMAYGGAKGEEAYLANRDRVIKRELAKAQEAGETRKERKNRIKNYDHNYLQEYIELFRSKNKNDETAIKDIMSQMGVTENDTLFIGNSNNLSGARMFPEFKLQQYLASQIDPEAYNAGQPVNVNYKNKAPYYTSDPSEDGRSYDFKTADYYDDDNGYIHLIKSKKQNGGEQTVEVDSRMLAKLIAAGADIEKL